MRNAERQTVEQLMAELDRRRDMLLGAYMVETGRRFGEVQLAVRGAPPLVCWWVEPAALRRSPRQWLRDWLLEHWPPWRKRLAFLAKEMHSLGLKATETAVFQAPGQVYFAEKRRLQVRCQKCRKSIALADWPQHVAKTHGGPEA